VIDRATLERIFWAYFRLFPVALPTLEVMDRAMDLTARFSLSHWDSLLIGACIEAGVTLLHTEDMGAPGMIGTIRLQNPFA
jgi:predicted nucleic acid-binding protein